MGDPPPNAEIICTLYRAQALAVPFESIDINKSDWYCTLTATAMSEFGKTMGTGVLEYANLGEEETCWDKKFNGVKYQGRGGGD